MNTIKNYRAIGGALDGQLMSLWNDEVVVQFLDPADEKEYMERGSMNSAPEDFKPWGLLTYQIKGGDLVLDGLSGEEIKKLRVSCNKC
jgi:hypothetical protein